MHVRQEIMFVESFIFLLNPRASNHAALVPSSRPLPLLVPLITAGAVAVSLSHTLPSWRVGCYHRLSAVRNKRKQTDKKTT